MILFLIKEIFRVFESIIQRFSFSKIIYHLFLDNIVFIYHKFIEIFRNLKFLLVFILHMKLFKRYQVFLVLLSLQLHNNEICSHKVNFVLIFVT